MIRIDVEYERWDVIQCGVGIRKKRSDSIREHVTSKEVGSGGLNRRGPDHSPAKIAISTSSNIHLGL